jgi:hypothetical protein
VVGHSGSEQGLGAAVGSRGWAQGLGQQAQHSSGQPCWNAGSMVAPRRSHGKQRTWECCLRRRQEAGVQGPHHAACGAHKGAKLPAGLPHQLPNHWIDQLQRN